MDSRTAACLFDGGGGRKPTTSVDDQLRRAVDDDVQSDGGHRAVVLRGAEGCGRTTALRRFVDLVAASPPDQTPRPLVVARRSAWPGRTAVDLLCDVVAQLGAVVDVDETSNDDDDDDDDVGIPARVGSRRVDLDGLVKSYAGLLRAFSESSPGRLVVDGTVW